MNAHAAGQRIEQASVLVVCVVGANREHVHLPAMLWQVLRQLVGAKNRRVRLRRKKRRHDQDAAFHAADVRLEGESDSRSRYILSSRSM